MTQTLPMNRDARPGSIRLHTMSGRIKIYEVDDWWIADSVICFIGTNIESNHYGRFFYPICNLEHWNLDEPDVGGS